jgi:predicted phage tail protein
MKEVEAAQLLDVKLTGELALQFGRREEMKVEAHMAPVRELDFIFVLAAILTELTRFLH